MKCQKCNEVPTKEFPIQANIKNKDNPYLQLVYFDMCDYNEEYEKILSELGIEDNTYSEAFQNRLNFLENKYGEDKIDKVFFYDQLRNTVGDIKLVCRYCAGWNDTYK